MTREETLKHFKAWCQNNIGNHCSDEDFQMANNIMALLEQEPCEDAISRILKRMWNCRGEHTTSIDKVKMEQIICDELPSVNPQESIDYKAQYDSFVKKAEIVISQLRADRDRLADFLDKIRAEIEEHAKINQNLNTDRARALCWCLDVIDKYKAESEE